MFFNDKPYKSLGNHKLYLMQILFGIRYMINWHIRAYLVSGVYISWLIQDLISIAEHNHSFKPFKMKTRKLLEKYHTRQGEKLRMEGAHLMLIL